VKPLLRLFEKAKAPFRKRPAWFAELYFGLLGYNGDQSFQEVIQPWRPKADRAIEALRHYEQINSPTNPYEVKQEDLWQ
jgi:hypothetical protein